MKLAPGQSSITIRTHFIDTDAAAEIADRAKAMRSGVATRTTSGTDEPADHLADIADVIGDTERMRTQEVLQRLAERNPGEYRDWTFQSLTAVLDAAGCPPYTSGGIRVVARARVRAALDTREAATDSE